MNRKKPIAPWACLNLETGETREHYAGMRPIRFSFVTDNHRVYWIRFYRCSLDDALADCKRVAIRENSDASGFMIETDQGSEEIRRSWGLT